MVFDPLLNELQISQNRGLAKDAQADLVRSSRKERLMNSKFSLSLLAAACMATAGVANAESLLIDGHFNNAASWSKSAEGGGWANVENSPAVSLNGSQYLVTGAAGNGGGGRFWQTVAASAGLNYTLDVFSGADAWWLPTGTMTLYFMSSDQALLGSAARNTVDPADYDGGYDIPHPWKAYSLSAIAPEGTSAVRVEFAANNATGSIWFENATLNVSAVPEPSSWLLMGLGVAALLGVRRRLQASQN